MACNTETVASSPGAIGVDADAGDGGMTVESMTIAHAVMLPRARWRTIIRLPLARTVDDFDHMPSQNVRLCISCRQRGARIDSPPADTICSPLRRSTFASRFLSGCLSRRVGEDTLTLLPAPTPGSGSGSGRTVLDDEEGF